MFNKYEVVGDLMWRILGTIVLALALSAPLLLLNASGGSAQTTAAASEKQLQGWSPYMAPDVLHALIETAPQIQVVDIRSKKYLKKGIISGATYMPFPDWRGPSSRPGQPPTEDQLAELIGNHGLRLDRPIVIHNQSGHTIQNGRAAIVYWILKSAGAEDIAILQGGFKAWHKAGFAQVDEHRVSSPISVDVTYRRNWWADPVDIFAVASGQRNGAILDARLDGQVKKSIKTGKPMQSMPMATYIPAGLFTRHLTAKSLSVGGKTEFRADLANRGIDLEDSFLISVCQTGELSALSWFYASEILGLENVRYYPDALQGWQSDGGLMFGLQAALQSTSQ